MIWLTWRQFRTPAVVVFAALAAVATGLAITGQHVASLYHTYGNNFLDQFSTDSSGRPMFFLGTAVVYALPAVIGAFWGAPLVARELEAGTHKLIWNQSITRDRWLANKFGLIGLAAAGAGLVSAAMTWWCGPIDKVINAGTESDEEPFTIPRLSSTFFGGRGIVPIGYAVFAFAIGVTIGLVLHRTVAAMAVTLVVVAAVQLLVPLAVVPHLLAPVTTSVAINPETIRTLGIHQEGGPIEQLGVRLDNPGAWTTANETVDRSNKVTQLPAWTSECVGIPGQETAKTAACFARLAKEGYHQRVQYLPASRYWPLQWIVTTILLGLSLLSAGFSFWWLRQRLT